MHGFGSGVSLPPRVVPCGGGTGWGYSVPVSYTHLDVYKRQEPVVAGRPRAQRIEGWNVPAQREVVAHLVIELPVAIAQDGSCRADDVTQRRDDIVGTSHHPADLPQRGMHQHLSLIHI